MPTNNRSEYILLAVLIVAIVLGVVGWAVSPVDADGRPLLLLPGVKKVEDYRRVSRTWIEDMRLIDGQLTTVLSDQGDLLSQSQSGQKIFEKSLSVAKEIDVAESPAALVGFKSMLSNTALAYFDASRAVLLWISAPKQEYYDQAVLLVQTARVQLAELEASSWINP